MRFLITGATGLVGGAIAEAASSRGHDVRAIVRDESRAAALATAGVELVQGELLGPDAEARLVAALADRDVLVHAAASYSYSRGDAERMVAENPAIARTVLGAARAAGTSHVIDISSAIVYRPYRDGPLRGRTDLGADRWTPADRAWGDPYLRSKVLGEQEADAARQQGVPISTVHPALVIGPGDRRPGTSGGVLLAIMRGPAIPAASFAWTDVRDLAESVLTVAARPAGEHYLVTSETVSARNVARRLDAIRGKRGHRLFLPHALVRATASLNDRFGGGLVPDLPLRAGLEFLLGTGPIDGTSGGPAIGAPYRPLDETFRDTLAWWAANGVVTRAEAGRAAA